MRRNLTLALLVTLLLVLVVAPGVPVRAADATPTPAPGLVFFTRYPAQEAALGENVTFDLTLRSGGAPQAVRLEMQDTPPGWTINFKGGGRVIQAAYVEPQSDTKIELRVEPPKDVKAGAYKFTALARSADGQQLTLPMELTLKDKAPSRLTFSVELPTLMGAPDSTFRYSLGLKNEGDTDLTVNLVSAAPPGFQVGFKLGGQDVTNIPVAANETKNLSVEAKAYPDLAAGQYALKVTAQGGEAQTTTELAAVVTGQSSINLTGPDGRLSGQAYIGDVTPFKLIVQNNGSAPSRNIQLSASQPAGWKVEFNPEKIDEIAAGKELEVTANVQPADQAIAGDYVVSMRAQPEDGPSKSADFRVTVLTSTLWGIVGVGLIAVAVIVVGLAVTRFGRR